MFELYASILEVYIHLSYPLLMGTSSEVRVDVALAFIEII
jgi:hypothetical protein